MYCIKEKTPTNIKTKNKNVFITPGLENKFSLTNNDYKLVNCNLYE